MRILASSCEFNLKYNYLSYVIKLWLHFDRLLLSIKGGLFSCSACMSSKLFCTCIRLSVRLNKNIKLVHFWKVLSNKNLKYYFLNVFLVNISANEERLGSLLHNLNIKIFRVIKQG